MYIPIIFENTTAEIIRLNATEFEHLDLKVDTDGNIKFYELMKQNNSEWF